MNKKTGLKNPMILIILFVIILYVVFIKVAVGINQTEFCEVRLGYNLTYSSDLLECAEFWGGWNTTTTNNTNITYINLNYTNSTTIIQNFYNQTLEGVDFDEDDYYDKDEIDEIIEELEEDINKLNTTDQLELIREQNRHTEQIAKIEANKTPQKVTETGTLTNSELLKLESENQILRSKLANEKDDTPTTKTTTQTGIIQEHPFIFFFFCIIIAFLFMTFFYPRFSKFLKQNNTNIPIEQTPKEDFTSQLLLEKIKKLEVKNSEKLQNNNIRKPRTKKKTDETEED
jgi:hypothetical protein